MECNLRGKTTKKTKTKNAPKQEQNTGERDKTEGGLGLPFPTDHPAPAAVQPAKETFHLPAAFFSAEWPSVLGLVLAIASMGCNDLHAMRSPRGVQRIGVIGLVADQAFRQAVDKAGVERLFHQLDFVRVGTADRD